MTVTSLPVNLVKKLWASQLWVEAQDDIFFKRFIGEGENNIIHKKNDLKKEKGDQITLGLAMKLSGAGISGDSTLEGNEEQMTFYDMSVTIDQIRNGVRLKGKMEEQKTAANLRQSAKNALKVWLSEKIDNTFFTTLATSPSAGRVLFGGDATATAEIVDADKLTTTLISTAKRKAMLATPKIRPVKIDGKEHYMMLVHPYAARDLKTDTAWLNAQKDANLRGDKNPIFSGALGIWDGVILFEHENVRLTTDGASSANVAWNTLLGAQAGVWAIGKEAFWEEDTFDYGNQQGFATGIIHGIKKSIFNGEDFAVITVETGAKAD